MNVLLTLLMIYSSHIGVSIIKQIYAILTHFRISDNFGYTITNNASKNTACLDHLLELLKVDLDKRYMIYIGHVINLVV
jgi:hypothetical protein